jgi:hypothetical protein
MPNTIKQNRLVIELACECLRNNGFTNVNRNKDQGTFPNVYATATDSGIQYLVGITGREETSADAGLNPAFNIVRTATDRRRARVLARNMGTVLAFVAVALRREDSSYSAHFGELERIGFPRSIPMLPRDRVDYRPLAIHTHDTRVGDLSLS